MNRTVRAGERSGTVAAVASKSMAHRLLIATAFGKQKTVLFCRDLSKDILATVDCLRALGAEIKMEDGAIAVDPIVQRKKELCKLPCGESGSTLRFLLPLVGALGVTAVFEMEGRLPERPLAPLDEELTRHGMTLRKEKNLLFCEGKLMPGQYTVAGNISSQYISGLLFALPLLAGDSMLSVTETVESKDYIMLTEQTLKKGHVVFTKEQNNYQIKGAQRFALGREETVEGDYSNAAYLEILNDAGGNVILTGLRADSLQGDRVYGDYLRKIREGTPELDVTDCPDLAPALIAAAAMHHGARLTGTRRLRLKESDRGAAMTEEMAKFGILLENGENEIVIPDAEPRRPADRLSGHNDHRIVMALAAVCVKTGGEIDGAEAVRKSFPGYWERLKVSGIRCQVSEEQAPGNS